MQDTKQRARRRGCSCGEKRTERASVQAALCEIQRRNREGFCEKFIETKQKVETKSPTAMERTPQ